MTWLWIGFIGFVLLMLTLDLAVFHRKEHAVSLKESLTWVTVYFLLSLSFSVLVYLLYSGRLGIAVIANDPNIKSGFQAAMMYLTGYIIEMSLSMDNMFVIALIMAYFKVPAHNQHRVLFWGILGRW